MYHIYLYTIRAELFSKIINVTTTVVAANSFYFLYNISDASYRQQGWHEIA